MQLRIITSHKKKALVISTPAVLQKRSERVVPYSNGMSHVQLCTLVSMVHGCGQLQLCSLTTQV